jgi:putative oxidoreductase
MNTLSRTFNLLDDAQDLAARIGRALSWAPPALARLTVGLIFFQSGWGKLHNLSQVTDYFAELGLPAPAFQATLASTTELVCGGLLLVGFLTRFAAVPLIITMIVAICTALWDQVDGLSSLFGLSEFLYVVLLAWLATHGPGPISVDWLYRTSRSGSADDLTHSTLDLAKRNA